MIPCLIFVLFSAGKIKERICWGNYKAEERCREEQGGGTGVCFKGWNVQITNWGIGKTAGADTIRAAVGIAQEAWGGGVWHSLSEETATSIFSFEIYFSLNYPQAEYSILFFVFPLVQ